LNGGRRRMNGRGLLGGGGVKAHGPT
jgi:hypothetical protein